MWRSNDGNPVELGVKFQTSVPGTITGIRFYKSPAGHRHACREPVEYLGYAARERHLYQ